MSVSIKCTTLPGWLKAQLKFLSVPFPEKTFPSILYEKLASLVEAVVPEEATESLSLLVVALVLPVQEYNKNEDNRIAKINFKCFIILFLKMSFF